MYFKKICQSVLIMASILFLGCETEARESEAELRRGVSIINKHYPKMMPSGRCRADKASVYKGTLRFHYTSFISGTVSYQKAIFWPDVITRSKAPNLSKLIMKQGALYHEYRDKRGNFLFLFKVTPEDLKRF